jgi:hypothetical protein
MKPRKDTVTIFKTFMTRGLRLKDKEKRMKDCFVEAAKEIPSKEIS